ncbi:MAG: hypothetical protein ACI9YP_000090 [Colwellia sp.]|jgi:hypothetical protein
MTRVGNKIIQNDENGNFNKFSMNSNGVILNLFQDLDLTTPSPDTEINSP